MNKFKYVYKCPTESGMIKLKISLRDLYKNGLSYRGKPIFVKAHVYSDDEWGVIEYRTNLFAKILNTLLYPLYIIIGGYKDAGKIVMDMWFEVERGQFSSDSFYFNRDSKVVKYIQQEYLKCQKKS